MSDPIPPRAESLLSQLGWLHRLARSLVRDEHQADDLTQETLLAAIERPPDSQGGGLRGFLATVARRRAATSARGEARRNRREREVGLREEPTGARSPEDLLERAELQRALVNCVMELGDPYREVLLLRFFEGYSPREIADRRDTTAATIRSQIRRALEQLRERLDRAYGDGKDWRPAIIAFVAHPPPGLFPVDPTPIGSAASQAGATKIGTSSSVATAVAMGGIVMSLKTTAIAVVTVAAIGLGAWYALQPPTSTAPTPTESVKTESSEASSGVSSFAGGVTDGTPAIAEDETFAPSAGPTIATVKGDGVIQGTVRDLDGRPLEGIVVHAFHGTDLGRELGLEFSMEVIVQGGGAGAPAIDDPERRVVTGPDGAFEIDGLAANTYAVIARGEGYRAGTVSKVEVDEEAPSRVEVTLEPGFTIDGIVYDPNGRPIEGAEVSAGKGMVSFATEGGASYSLSWRIGDDGTDLALPARNVAKTDARGRFRLEGLSPGNHRLAAKHSGWAQSETVQVAAGSRGVELSLRIGSTLTGRVFDPAGEPLAGASVWAEGGSESGVSRVTTDSDGAFVLNRVAPGRYRLTAEHPDYPSARSDRFEFADGEEVEPFALSFEPAQSITGLVLDAAGEPVAGARVRTGPVGFGFRAGAELDRIASFTVTEDDGRFELGRLRAGRSVTITVDHTEHLAEELSVEVGEGLNDIGEIRLRTGGFISGTITDALSGDPIDGARAALVPYREETHARSIMFSGIHSAMGSTGGVTNEAGIYQISRVEPGDYQLRVEAAGRAPFLSDVFSIAAGQRLTAVDFALGGGGTISGVVTDASGVPVAGARVSAIAFQPMMSRASAQTDADGHFRLEGLEADRDYRVSVAAKGWSPSELTEVRVGAELAIQLDQPGQLIGVVTDLATGRAIEQFSVKAEPIGQSPLARFSAASFDLGSGSKFNDPNGEFRLDSLAPGRYRLRIVADGYVVHEDDSIRIESGRVAEVAVALDVGGAVDGYVRDGDGNPISGVTVRRPKAGESAREMAVAVLVEMDGEGQQITSFGGRDENRVTTDESGYYLLPNLPIGEVELEFDSRTHLDARKTEVKVERGQTRRLEAVVLEKGSTLEGSVVRADGTPVTQGSITLLRIDGEERRPPQFRQLSKEGTFELTGLAAGKYRAQAQAWGTNGDITVTVSSSGPPPRGSEEVTLGQDEERSIRIVVE